MSVLCCSDLSESSRSAVHEALRLGDALQAPVTFLHVCPPPYPDPGYLSLAVEDVDLLELAGSRVRRAAQIALDALVREMRDALALGGVPTRTVIREGLVAKTIVEEAELEDAELIVIGTHARSGLPHVMLGSVAERVMRTASRPVLTVPPGLH
ncbi:MAG TPA: universal stress protein [Candidatus Polarisedimenticolaceae bacterium]|nr:universal stress protein [Candidatus Polarisedimenticolaceae bacterium]